MIRDFLGGYRDPEPEEKTEQPTMQNALAKVAAMKSGNPLAMLAVSGDNGMNPLALMALSGHFGQQYGPAMNYAGVNPGIAGAFQRQYGPATNPSAGPSNPNYRTNLTGDISTFAAAIKNVESGSPEGNYSVVGPPTKNGGRAYGAYQVMDFNIPNWTREVLGREYTPQQFLADPAAQDAVFKAKFGALVEQYGNPQDAASVWFSGRPMRGNTSSDGYTSVPTYIQRFNAGL